MRRSNAPTLQDVAQQAGVTAMMASVVLNNARSSTRVSEATRSRILKAAAQLGYRRNAAAVGLARRQMDTLGVVAVIDGGDINLYFHEVLNGILAGAAENRQNTTLFSIEDWKTDEKRILDWCDGRIDGLILVGPLVTEAFGRNLPAHTPLVTIHGNIRLPNTHNLDINNAEAAQKLTRYLIANGHQDIIHISGGPFSGANARAWGFRQAIEEAGIPWDDSRIVPGKFSAEAGRSIMRSLLARPHAPLPDAIFCANDAIAFGCMEVLNSEGIVIPRDISIAGFDDTLLARMTHPPLTTIHQPFRAMGRRAIEILLEQRTGSGDATAEQAPAGEDPFNTGAALNSELFPVELVVRDTVRRID